MLALLGLSYFRGNQFSEARPIYEALVEKAPADASHRLNLGLVYLKLNDGEHAIESLEASRALDPSQGRAVSYLGLAYARAGRYAEAYRSFLLAGQNDLATEIEINLTPAERDGIHAQLGRTPSGPLPVVGRTPTPQPAAAIDTPRAADAPAERAAQQAAPKADSSHPRPWPPPASAPAPVVAGDQPSRPTRRFQKVDEIAITSRRPSGLDSMQFVIPKADPPAPVDGQSMVSMAVARRAGSIAPTRRSPAASHRAAVELATEELVRPDDGTDPFEIMPGGALIIRVSERMFTRPDGVHVTGGDLTYEPAMRRSRGHQIEERFDQGGSALHAVTGKGYLIATPAQAAQPPVFLAVELDDDILYLREDLVFAFESTLRWENGNVPGLRGKLHVVQFRGDGALALRLQRPLVRVKLPPQGLVFVDAERLAGWVGRVIPRAVVPPKGGPLGSTCIECTGEGIVLVEPAAAAAPAAVSGPEPSVPVIVVPEEPAKPEIDPEVAAFAAGFDDDEI